MNFVSWLEINIFLNLINAWVFVWWLKLSVVGNGQFFDGWPLENTVYLFFYVLERLSGIDKTPDLISIHPNYLLLILTGSFMVSLVKKVQTTLPSYFWVFLIHTSTPHLSNATIYTKKIIIYTKKINLNLYCPINLEAFIL